MKLFHLQERPNWRIVQRFLFCTIVGPLAWLPHTQLLQGVVDPFHIVLCDPHQLFPQEYIGPSLFCCARPK